MVADITSEINYLVSTNDGRAPWRVENIVPTATRTNFVEEATPVTVHDLRGEETSVNLDTHGFEVFKYNGIIQDEFEKDSEAQKICYQEVTDLIKERFGAVRVFVLQHSFRFRSAPLSNEKLDANHRNPIFYPHVDLSSTGVQRSVDMILGQEEGEKLRKHRVQLINIWRPLGPIPITNGPLALCDYRSIDVEKDVQPYTIHRVDFNLEGYTLSRNDQHPHEWYYMSQMRSDEMYLFKLYDSKPDVAQYVFHTAVKTQDESMPNEEHKDLKKPQRSIELRCFVVYDD